MRLPDDPRPGLVLCYSYLWKREHAEGALEGRKHRPAVVVLARQDLGPSRVLYVVPISHAAPLSPGAAVEIPATVKRRLDLDDMASFIHATEMNVFVWPGPDLRPVRRQQGVEAAPCFYGYLPRGVFASLKAAIDQNRRQGTLSPVKR